MQQMKRSDGGERGNCPHWVGIPCAYFLHDMDESRRSGWGRSMVVDDHACCRGPRRISNFMRFSPQVLLGPILWPMACQRIYAMDQNQIKRLRCVLYCLR